MKKLTIALALSCFSLAGFAQESSEEIVKETEVSIGSDVETVGSAEDATLQNDGNGGCGCGKGKGKGGGK